jgi:hypothetical protein
MYKKENSRFKLGDIVSYYDQKSLITGIYWEIRSDFEDSELIIYFPTTCSQMYIKISNPEKLELFPADKETALTYVTNLINDQKISFPHKEVSPRSSEFWGEDIYCIGGFIIKGLKTLQPSNEPKWLDELIWCPSQCYCSFIDETEKKIYCIYLRWRHHDPWSAEIIPCNPDGKLTYNNDWETIKTHKTYKEMEYEELKKEAVKIIQEKFSNITWLDNEEL